MQPRFYILSGVVVLLSGVLGMGGALALWETKPALGYPLAAVIGMSPWESLKLLVTKRLPLGTREEEKSSRASFREFVHL